MGHVGWGGSWWDGSCRGGVGNVGVGVLCRVE